MLLAPLSLAAQEFCYSKSFLDFALESRVQCKNLVIGKLQFEDNGNVVFPTGDTRILDSIAVYLATNQYIFEIDYEVKGKSADEKVKHQYENAIRNYLISKSAVNQMRAFPEAHTRIDHNSYIPKNMKEAFFFVCIYPGKGN